MYRFVFPYQNVGFICSVLKNIFGKFIGFFHYPRRFNLNVEFLFLFFYGFRYGSVKSAHRRTGKIKGIERILGTVDQVQESLIEVTSGQAKYEHHHRAIVWRCPRLPKDGQGKLSYLDSSQYVQRNR